MDILPKNAIGPILNNQPDMSRSIKGTLKTTNSNNKTRVVLNIGGVHFETCSSTLRRVSNTRLSKLTIEDESYDSDKCEYFFDRHPVVFAYILNFYRTGELHLPVDECGPLIEAELKFWNINEGDISTCCWLNYCKYIDYNKHLKLFDELFDVGAKSNEAIQKRKIEKEKMNGFQRLRFKIWYAIQYPHASKTGKLLGLISLSFIMLTIFTIIFETYRPWYINTVYNQTLDSPIPILVQGEPSSFFKISDYICVAYFTMEFLIKLICCQQSLLSTFTNLFEIIDLITLIIYYVQIISGLVDERFSCLDKTLCLNNTASVLYYLQLFRIFRVFKIFKHFSGLKVLAYTFKSSFRELLLIIILLLISVLIFACLIYFVEGDPNAEHFENIPTAFWFSLSTMTTVGYGDLVPVTPGGYLIASCCAVSGVLLIAFTVPIAVQNFTIYYTHAQSRLKNPNLRKSEWKNRRT